MSFCERKVLNEWCCTVGVTTVGEGKDSSF